MQDSNTATTQRAGAGARWEPVMDRTTAMRVSRSAVPPILDLFPSSSFLPPSAPVYDLVLRKCLHSEDSR
jgi:hypothetical protein